MYALLALLFALPAKANLVSYVDDAGTRHFVQSEAEVPEKYRKTMKDSHAGGAPAASPAPAAGPPPAAAAAGTRGAEPAGQAGSFTPPPGVSLPAGINLKDLPAPPPDMNLPGE